MYNEDPDDVDNKMKIRLVTLYEEDRILIMRMKLMMFILLMMLVMLMMLVTKMKTRLVTMYDGGAKT